VHHHLVPGEGAIDFDATLKAIGATGYTGWITFRAVPLRGRPRPCGADRLRARSASCWRTAEPGDEHHSGHASAPTARPPGCLAYAQLVRIPNVFTAIADIALAALVTGSLPGWPFHLGCWRWRRSCLYCAGMVWNDYFDFDQDLKERPFRPLPSYRVSTGAAVRLAVALCGAGVVLAALAGLRANGWTAAPLALRLLLVVAILLYDGWLKRNFLGPLSMGFCRFLNVLLGLNRGCGRGAVVGIRAGVDRRLLHHGRDVVRAQGGAGQASSMELMRRRS